MQRICLALTALLLSTRLSADVGDWHIYAAYHDAQRVAEVGGIVYVLSDGGLYSYDPEDTYVDTYDKTDVLSDNGIFDIRLCEETNQLVIVYENGNIDLMDTDGGVYNMPDIKTSSLSDKTVNDILVQDGWLYVCTNSGLVCVDIAGLSFGNTYSWGEGVRSVALMDGIFYASTTDDGLYTADTADNLLDPTNWTLIRDLSLKRLIVCGETLFFMSTNLNRFTNLASGAYTRVANSVANVNIVGDNLFAYSTTLGSMFVVEEDGSCTTYTDTIGVNELFYSSGTYWAACGEKGLQAVAFTDDQYLAVTTGSIIPDSPLRNYAYRLSMEDGERLLVAGGWANYSTSVMREGTIMCYEDGKWTHFDEDDIAAVRGNCYRNVTCVVQDPQDSEHHFAAAHNAGLYEFQSGDFVTYYAEDNSPLVSALDEGDANESLYVRVDGLAYDDDHNLWMLNCETDTIIRILQDDGTWASLYIADIAGHPTFDHILFDQRGWAWINDRRSTNTGADAGFIVLNTNGTLTSQGDDTWRVVTSFANQDGTTYSPTLTNCLCEDLNGYIWVGNDRGLFVTYDPASVFDDDFYLTQVKVPRNDGSGLADYLLSDITVKCITIDGGNRKWVGTSGNGVFLLSEDGLETVEQFTSDNSPLPSDDVYDIAIDPQSGEVFIATDAGLASYMGDATDPVDALDKDLVRVYPNPVRPEYSGDITIRGLAINTDVKIVNTAGRLVHTGTSVGGSYTWNGCLSSGKQCASGMYYILATDEAGENGVVGKFLMVRE